MLKYMDFVVYCIEEFRWANKLTGRQVIAIFAKHNVYSFIEDSYEALHTYGSEDILWNLRDYLEQRSSTREQSD